MTRKTIAGNFRFSMKKKSKNFKRAAALLMSALMVTTCVTIPEVQAQEKDTKVLAWDGVEGGGRYTTGGRGKPVYHVTSLEDYLLKDNAKNGEKANATAPVEGTLRYGIEVFAKENDGAMIVFDVAGNIKLLSTLGFSYKENDVYKGYNNITIAGQTAPGDGITITGMDTNISNCDNIIIRYIRFRPGRAYVYTDAADSIDAFWGRDNSNFIIDHCSFSWNTDETLSIYRGENGTVSNNIISESLTISGHSKGRHGYGAIWGGDNVTFTNNLISSHTSRNPRFGGGAMGDPTTEGPYYKRIATLQASNNVIYNWGFNGAYGLGWTHTNFINNYIKAGNGTRDSVEDLIINPGEADGQLGPKEAGVYVNGNVVEGNAEYSADNSLGIKMNPDPAIAAVTEIANKPYEAEGFASLTVLTAEEAYAKVLATAGATYPRRDAIDARVVADVEANTGRFVNTEDEAGGYISEAGVITAQREAGYDTDGDGMPDAYEDTKGFDKNDASDGQALASTGRSNLEEYLNSITDINYEPTNPEVSLSLVNNAQYDEGETIQVTVTASDDKGIDKVDLYNGKTKLESKTTTPYTFEITGLTNGSYNISARAYDVDGNSTQSTAAVIHVNNPSKPTEWTSKDIGNPGIAGSASYGTETINGNTVENVLTVKGAGKLGSSEGNVSGKPWSDAKTDDFQYTYQKISGDCELVTRIEEVSTVDNHAFTGLMFRETLDQNSKAVIAGMSFVKYTNTTWSVYLGGRDTTGGEMSDLKETIDSESGAAKAGISLIADIPFRVQKDKKSITQGTWLKLIRTGNTFTAYTSQDGAAWRLIGTKEVEMSEEIYIGFAVDGNKVANNLDNLSWAQFSNISVNKNLHSVTSELTNLTAGDMLTSVADGEDLQVTLVPEDGYELPETVEVTVGGVTVAAKYDSKTGVVTITNVTGDVVIKATGAVRKPAEKQNYEIINLGKGDENALNVTTNEGVLTFTQKATSGGMADKNISYLVFPETTEQCTLSAKIKIKSNNYDKGSGLFMGVFMPDAEAGSRYFMSLGFRNPNKEAGNSLSGFWTKPTSTGNGSPKTTLNYDEEYTVDMYWDKGILVVDFSSKNLAKLHKEFRKTDVNAALYPEDGNAAVRYGIAISGTVAEVRDLVYKNSIGEVLYDSNDVKQEEQKAPTVLELSKPVVSEDKKSVSVTWNGEGMTDDGTYVVEAKKDDGSYEVVYEGKDTSYSMTMKADGSDNGTYSFKVYGKLGDKVSEAKEVSVDYEVVITPPDPTPGEIVADKTDGNADTAVKVEITEALKEAVDAIEYTEAEREAIAAGEDIKVYLKVDNSTPDADTKALVESKAGDKATGIKYYDISMLRKVAENPEQKLTTLGTKVSITMDIPADIKAADRTYYIIRVHNGAADILNDLDNNADTITFETDRFSTYALVYSAADEGGEDKPPVTPPEGGEDKPPVTPPEEGGNKPVTPPSSGDTVQTGDMVSPLPMILMMVSGSILAVFGITAIFKKKRYLK